MDIIKNVNLGLRFLLELAALGALGYWGFKSFDGALRWIVGIGAPLAAAIVWGLFVAPQATFDVADPIKYAIEVAVFGAAFAALWYSAPDRIALTFAGLVILHWIVIAL